jgi:hypothetical protein
MRALTISVGAGGAVCAALLAAACGGSSSTATSVDPAASAVSSATSESTSTPKPPTDTPVRPTQTPTPTATSTPTPTATPTPAVLTFSVADSGDGKASGKHKGLFGVVFSDGEFGYDLGRRQVQVSSSINVGISETPYANGWVENYFGAPDLGGGTTRAHVAGAVSWKGVLAGNGIAGTKAAVDITLKVIDDASGRTVATKDVHSKEIQESALTLGGFDDVGDATADFNADLVPGKLYTIRLEANCEARSGLLAASTFCIFGKSDAFDQGYVRWSDLSITFAAN